MFVLFGGLAGTTLTLNYVFLSLFLRITHEYSLKYGFKTLYIVVARENRSHNKIILTANDKSITLILENTPYS